VSRKAARTSIRNKYYKKYIDNQGFMGTMSNIAATCNWLPAEAATTVTITGIMLA